jgi:dihydroorotase
MGLAPASIAEGQAADMVLFDPAATSTFTAAFMQSKSQNTPFLDQTLRGRVDLVVLGTDVLLDRCAPPEG